MLWYIQGHETLRIVYFRRIRTHSSTLTTTFALRSKSAKYVVGITWYSSGGYRYYNPPEKVLCSKRNISTVLCTNTHSFELLVFNLCTAFIYPIKVRVYSPRFSFKKTQTRHLSYLFIFCTLYGVIRLTRDEFSLFQKTLTFPKMVRFFFFLKFFTLLNDDIHFSIHIPICTLPIYSSILIYKNKIADISVLVL